MTLIDTPDYQRGVVSAQVLLATVAGGTSLVRIGIPPNAETLVVACSGNVDLPDSPEVIGVPSNVSYIGTVIALSTNVAQPFSWVFDISNAIDGEAVVVFTTAPGHTWYVYSDSAVHTVSDVSNVRAATGEQYVIPTAPSTIASDHPPVELKVASFDGTASGTHVIPAQLSTQRLRIMHAAIGPTTATDFSHLGDTVSGAAFLTSNAGSGTGVVVMDYTPTGYALSAGAGVIVKTGGASSVGTIVYTVENI